MNVFKSMDFRYHEVKHTECGSDAFVESFSLAQIACNMRMERQSGNGMGMERLVKDKTRGGRQHGMKE